MYGLIGPRSAGLSLFREPITEGMKRLVWEKGRIILGRDPREWRLDACGALMRYSAYGDRTEQGNGWEVDHVVPKARGGLTVLENLQPLQWQNNLLKGDNWPLAPYQYAAVRFKGYLA